MCWRPNPPRAASRSRLFSSSEQRPQPPRGRLPDPDPDVILGDHGPSPGSSAGSRRCLRTVSRLTRRPRAIARTLLSMTSSPVSTAPIGPNSLFLSTRDRCAKPFLNGDTVASGDSVTVDWSTSDRDTRITQSSPRREGARSVRTVSRPQSFAQRAIASAFCLTIRRPSSIASVAR